MQHDMPAIHGAVIRLPANYPLALSSWSAEMTTYIARSTQGDRYYSFGVWRLVFARHRPTSALRRLNGLELRK